MSVLFDFTFQTITFTELLITNSKQTSVLRKTDINLININDPHKVEIS